MIVHISLYNTFIAAALMLLEERVWLSCDVFPTVTNRAIIFRAIYYYPHPSYYLYVFTFPCGAFQTIYIKAQVVKRVLYEQILSSPRWRRQSFEP